MEFKTLVSVLIPDQNGNILLVNEKKEFMFDKLNLPGGHIELGESLIEGAKREAMEEVQVEVEIQGLLGIYERFEPNHYTHFIFQGKIVNGTPTANTNEIKDVAWHPIEDINNYSDEQCVAKGKLLSAVSRYVQGKLGSLDQIIDDNQ
ncbi:NUDIX hydrolase [Candidatus Nomurabacteria bacterium]|nr:NUDIX hydrolase [Candidatus Nomurabacteria bacterium]